MYHRGFVGSEQVYPREAVIMDDGIVYDDVCLDDLYGGFTGIEDKRSFRGGDNS